MKTSLPILIILSATLALAACSGSPDNSEAALFSDVLPEVVPEVIPEPDPLPALEAQISVANGELAGVIPEDVELVHFQGIPYAAPPIGELRWKPPEAAANWDETRDASAPGPACIQAGTDSTDLQSEDCLYLNVAAPMAETPTARPVMVWFHGGGDENGSGHEVIYNLVDLANATGNVVVSVNSRLGFLGFYAHPDLATEDANGSTGNYHHLDQVAALQWVRDNILQFNGDPDNVTIFGESAGANGVCRHLSSRLSDDLYQRAILQSSTCGDGLLEDLDTAYTQGDFFAGFWGCDTSATPIDCARQQSAEDLRQSLADAGKSGLLEGGLIAQEVFRPAANIDGYVFTEKPGTAIANAPTDKEVIIGVNRNEITLFLTAPGNGNPENNDSSFDTALATIQPSLSAAQRAEIVTDLYPCANYASCSDAFADFIGDVVFVCPSVLSADTLNNSGHAVRFYHFTQPINNSLLLQFTVPEIDDNAPELGIPHSAELFYLWNLPVLQAGETAEQTKNAMQQYWGSFAATGEPVAEDQADWPVYNGRGSDYLQIGPTIEALSSFKAGKCEFIESLPIL